MAVSPINIPVNAIYVGSRHFSPSSSLVMATNNNDRYFANHPLLSLTDQCTSLSQLKQIHAQLLRVGLFFDPYSASKLFSALAISPLYDLGYAQKVFDQIHQPNLYTWNALLRAYASSDDPSRSLFIFIRMLHECPDIPNKFTFPFVIKAASSVVDDANLGRAIHGMAVKLMLDSDLFILNSLVCFYGACGNLDMAYKVFLSIQSKDVVSWNSMIAASVQRGCPDTALELFQAMNAENVKPNNFTFPFVIKAASSVVDDANLGRAIHGMAVKLRLDSDLFILNPLVCFYGACGNLDMAYKVFLSIQSKDVVSWNSMIAASVQRGCPDTALELFQAMDAENVKPNEVTLVCALSACAQLGAIDLGRWIHIYINKRGFKLDCYLSTALLYMYAKCGDLERALEVFHSVKRKDVFAWSAMIAGLAMHGHGKAAIDTFYRMQEAGVKPNAVTFINLLSACSHMGLVEEARLFFRQMLPVHGIEPQAQHYSCMVDVLGRAGYFDEVMDLIKMSMPHTAFVWSSLLGACWIHGNVDLAEVAFSRLIELEPRNDGAYVMLSNVYAKSGKWDKVSELRKLMRVSGLKKEQGYSSIEVHGTIHEFVVADNSHPMSTKIYSKLEEIALELKAEGYVPDKNQLLLIVEDEHMKEQALYLHSEKLAIVFGLLSLATSQPIRIMKNLRICGDCHSFAKAISKLYKREILVRDRYRFHRFKDGCCSCMDYW